MWITKLIKLFHSKKELFTLKRSRILRDFTLKLSRFYAETLPHSIYTYSYIYKKTNSWLLKSVDKWIFKNKLLLIVLFFPLISGCQKNIYIPTSSAGTMCVNERLATPTHPSQFYLCGNNCYPCHVVTNRWSGCYKTTKKNHRKTFKNIKEKVHAKNSGKNNCNCL